MTRLVDPVRAFGRLEVAQVLVLEARLARDPLARVARHDHRSAREPISRSALACVANRAG